METRRIAVIPGDGIGREVVPEGLRVLEAAARKFGFTADPHAALQLAKEILLHGCRFRLHSNR